MKERLLKKAVNLLIGIEWSNIKNGPREGSSFALIATCPACGGVDPQDPVARAYSVTGHTEKCKLAKLLPELQKEINK